MRANSRRNLGSMWASFPESRDRTSPADLRFRKLHYRSRCSENGGSVTRCTDFLRSAGDKLQHYSRRSRVPQAGFRRKNINWALLKENLAPNLWMDARGREKYPVADLLTLIGANTRLQLSLRWPLDLRILAHKHVPHLAHRRNASEWMASGRVSA